MHSAEKGVSCEDRQPNFLAVRQAPREEVSDVTGVVQHTWCCFRDDLRDEVPQMVLCCMLAVNSRVSTGYYAFYFGYLIR